MKSILALLVALTLTLGCSKPSCSCDPCTCENCECGPKGCKCPKAQTIVKPIDDSGKGYVTVIVPDGYTGWATKWADAKIKSENHYTVLMTSSPLYKERFAKAVPHAPCVLLQKANGQVVDKLYNSKAANCCPFKRWKKDEEQKEEKAAPIPDKEDVQEEIKEDKDHSGLYVLLGLAGAATGLAVVWHERKTTPAKKS